MGMMSIYENMLLATDTRIRIDPSVDAALWLRECSRLQESGAFWLKSSSSSPHSSSASSAWESLWRTHLTTLQQTSPQLHAHVRASGAALTPLAASLRAECERIVSMEARVREGSRALVCLSDLFSSLYVFMVKVAFCLSGLTSMC